MRVKKCKQEDKIDKVDEVRRMRIIGCGGDWGIEIGEEF